MSRILAGLVFCAYVCIGLVVIGWSAAVGIALVVAVPLACILFPEIMAEVGRGLRLESLPPGLVFGLGWFTFLLPGILAGILWLTVLRNV